MGATRTGSHDRTSTRGRRGGLVVGLLAAGLLLGAPGGGAALARDAGATAGTTSATTSTRTADAAAAAACTSSLRGIPTCGAYFGGSTGANADPTQQENQMGTVMGVRRTFFSAGQTGALVETARRDLARGRLPWVSIKVPHSWADMASGRGDAWVRTLVDRLDELDGPVWLAFHHEPEDDASSVVPWTRMQERLGPIVRQRADNVAFSVILMGYHQLYGAERLRFPAIWPRTKVDVSGFDVYNFQGMPQGGGIRTEPFDIRQKYFLPLQAWAQRNDTRWALAETGYTDYTSSREPEWIRRTFEQLKGTGGIAMSYFNSTLNSDANWTVSNDRERYDYRVTLGRTLRATR